MTESVLVGLDPSLNCPGWAIFVGEDLLAAGACPSSRLSKLELGPRCKAVAGVVLADIVAALAPHRGLVSVTELVYETPQVYQRGKSKGDPNDLIPLALVAGEVSGALGPVAVWAPTPAQWIGQVPKLTKGDPWASPRGLRIKVRLSLDEFEMVRDVRHDAVDAIGLCLARRGRMDRRRVFPGATPG